MEAGLRATPENMEASLQAQAADGLAKIKIMIACHKPYPVAAVVVTYNRLPLLQKCIEKLEAQTEPCDILVVNNASTDGTAEWLQKCEAKNKRLHARNTDANLGGAGGFNYGMRWAIEAGYEYLWLMDDDCLPEPDALEKLLDADTYLKGEYGWLSSVALWTDGSVCNMNLQRKTPYRDIDSIVAPLTPCVMASFVSLFLRAETVAEFGLPIKEFFIWSDDWEYTRRISLQKACYVAADSQVVHAMKSNTVVNIATDASERLERYRFFYRNDVYLYRREGLRGWLWLIAKDCWHSAQVIRKGRAGSLPMIWKGFATGICFRPKTERTATIKAAEDYE